MNGRGLILQFGLLWGGVVVMICGCEPQHHAPVALEKDDSPLPTPTVQVEHADPNATVMRVDVGTGRIEDLDCKGCHTAFVNFPVVHGALEKGECQSCHDPRAEQHPQVGGREFQLRREGVELCGECHADHVRHASPHSELDGACLGCHRPHVSEHEKLLKQESVRLVCMECHSTLFGADVQLPTHPHTPVRDGDCAGCHDPHGSEFPRMARHDPKVDLCVSCHQERGAALSVATVHQPVKEDCTQCHVPHGSNHEALLSESLATLCSSCHPAIGAQIAAPGAHAPLSECAHCHDPHGDQSTKLLRQNAEQLCRECHEPQLQTGPITHAALDAERSCLGCHDPHGSSNGKLLQRPQREGCISCHPDLGALLQISKKEGGSVHQPISEGACTGCHQPHAATEAKLLRGTYPKVIKQPFAAEGFDLCLGCHDSSLVTAKSTTSATRFRDGERNLHYVHVVENGRTCRSCHDPHASLQKHLVRTRLPFGQGGWEMPIEHVSDGAGGGCTKSCHVERNYSRVVAGASFPEDRPATGLPTNGSEGNR